MYQVLLLLQDGGSQVNPAATIPWDNLSIPAILGIIITAMVWTYKEQKKELKEKDREIKEIQEKRLDDKQKAFDALREINDETNDQFNKFIISWEMLERTLKNGTK